MKKQRYVKWYQSLVFKFTFIVVPLAILPLFIVSYAHYIDSTNRIQTRTYEDIRQNTILQKKFLLNWFHYREVDIKNISQNSNIVELMENLIESFQGSHKSLLDFVHSDAQFAATIDIGSELTRFEHDYDYVYDVFMIDLQGDILYTNEYESDVGTSLMRGAYKDTKFANAFRKTLKDHRIHFSDLELYAPSNNRVAGFLTAPIMDANGVFIGVLAVQIKLDKIYALFKENTFREKGVMQTYLVGTDNLLRTPLSGDKSQILKMKIQTAQLKLWRSEHLAQNDSDVLKQYDDNDVKEKVFVYKNPLGKDVFGLHHDIHILGVHWALVSEADESIIKNLQNDIIQKTLLIAFILFLIIVAVSILLVEYLVNPIVHLIELVKKFETGNRNIEIKIHSENEIGVLAGYFDEMISAIKKSEMELDEQKFALNAHAIVAVTDVGGSITYVNSKFEEISGYSHDELIGKNHRILNSKEKPKEYWQKMYKDISGGLVWHDEIKNIAKDGSVYWVDTTIVPFVDDNGKIVSYIAIRTDITEKKKDEFALIEAKKIADESVKVKAEFFASMSHEIRTPMNGIIGMLSLLLKTKLSEAQHHQAYLAQTSAQALLSLINDILDFSKFEANKLELEYKAFNIRDDFGDFAESIAFKAQEKGIDIILDVKDIQRKIVVADEYRIRQILNNIVGNAIKFTDEGYVLITASLLELNEEQARLYISVEDTGIGIPENKIVKLFDVFSQVDSSTTRKYGGTGLGLSIVKKLVGIMDGSIEVSSVEGQGSKFSIEIGLRLDEDSTLVTPEVSVKTKNALILDKSKKSAEVLAKQLQHWGMSVSLEQESEKNYDIIFISKDENAYALGESLKLQYKNARLILMTSLADTANVSHYMEFIYDSHFPQPATTQDILKSLRTLMSSYNAHEMYEATQEDEQVEFNPNTKILLVDDNKVNQLVALGLLEEFGLDADVAGNGLEAIEAVDAAHDEPYEIILMDCQMPELDGYDATRVLKSGKHGASVAKIPIVAMTANAMQGDKEKCFTAGMDDYISKPIDPARLEEVLKKYLL